MSKLNQLLACKAAGMQPQYIYLVSRQQRPRRITGRRTLNPAELLPEYMVRTTTTGIRTFAGSKHQVGNPDQQDREAEASPAQYDEACQGTDTFSTSSPLYLSLARRIFGAEFLESTN